MTVNRRWTLASYPESGLGTDNFKMVRETVAAHSLEPGEVLVRNNMFAVAPTIRNWLNPAARSSRGSTPIGGPIRGMAGCEVIGSAHPEYPIGTRMIAMSRWEDWSVIRPDQAPVPVFPIPNDMDFAKALGPLSLNALTAYFGLLRVGRPLRGETVLVSAAAGSVGSVVCQIARKQGCRVIGIAGGAEKCSWLEQECGCDAAIDYRLEDLDSRLRALCPAGVDLFFDNVGGAQLQTALNHIARGGRVILCGQISTYDDPEAPLPKLDMMKLVYGSIRMEGFVVGDFVAEADSARSDLSAWIEAGELSVKIDLRSGIDQLPCALVDLFKGNNLGTLLVAND